MRSLSSCIAVASSLVFSGDASAEQNLARKTVGVPENAVLVDAEEGATMFAQICAQTAPSFDQASLLLQKMPFNQNPDTGTFFHNVQNMSFNITYDQNSGISQCSMVLASNVEAVDIAIAFSIFVAGVLGNDEPIQIDSESAQARFKLPDGGLFRFYPVPLQSDYPYYRAVIATGDS